MFATALPGLEMGPLSSPVDAGIKPGYAIEIDCPTLLELGGGSGFLKGFASIHSTQPLTIVAVYTQANEEGQAVSIHTDRVSNSSGGKPEKPDERCADLVVSAIGQPQWNDVTRRSVINATITNIGDAAAPSTFARLIDPSTFQNTGAPHNSVAATAPIPAGGQDTVTFMLPYWVFNPDAELEVTADYKGGLDECKEDNNVREFSGLG